MIMPSCTPSFPWRPERLDRGGRTQEAGRHPSGSMTFSVIEKETDIFGVIENVAGHNTNILIQGESGTG